MSRKSGQGLLKFEACVNVGGIVHACGVDDILVGHTKLCGNILEGWWMEHYQESGDVSNGGVILELGD